MTTATPWERTKRLRTTSRPVVVGIMTDTSGSMGWAENFVADFAWTVATAGIRVGARTAAVTFGSRTEMVTRPGATPQQIRVRTANGSQEMFDEAAAALEGVLHFTTGAANAAKVLFIVSDGELVREGEPSRAAQRIEQFTNAGTLVVWVGASPHLQAGYHTHVRGSGRLVFIERSRDTAQMMTELEKSILTAARGMGV